jgi:quercetin dioxygenase-like cupin family protein
MTQLPVEQIDPMAGHDRRQARQTPGRRRAPFLVALAALVVVATAASIAASSGDTASAVPAGSASTHDHHLARANDIVYGPAPDALPPGAEMAVLQGDPSLPGQLFTIRLRLPNGYVLPPHWHPTDENVTVIKGTFLVGLGDVFDRKAMLPPLHRGDFISAPANANHFALARGRTEVQVHAIGPFAINYVNPRDDPRND